MKLSDLATRPPEAVRFVRSETGWLCGDGCTDCDEPAHLAIVEDGGDWYYQACCENEEHAAQTLEDHRWRVSNGWPHEPWRLVAEDEACRLDD